MKLIFATNNSGKLIEVQNIFKDSLFELISLKDLDFDEEIEETGLTFEENAFIKADAVYEKYNLPVIADDSGLEVEQLNGHPGIYSARYAGENATYEDNNRKLLQELNKFSPPHNAKFLCCAVYVDDKNRVSVNGFLEGEIIKEFRGQNGFGFDPVFKPKGFNITLAEMNLEDKNKISHRFNAFNNLRFEIKKII